MSAGCGSEPCPSRTSCASVVKMRHSNNHNLQIDNDCPTRRQLSIDRWLKTASDKGLGRLVEYKAIDENTSEIITNLHNLVVQTDNGVIVSSSAPELVGQQVVSYQF